MSKERHCEANDSESALAGASEVFNDELIDLIILLLLFGYSELFNFDNNGSAPVVIDKKQNTTNSKRKR